VAALGPSWDGSWPTEPVLFSESSGTGRAL
jgi:hypothetical protein